MATWILNNYENLYVAAMMILSVILIVCDMKWYWIPDLFLLILAGIQGLYLSVHTVQPNLAVMAGSVIFMIALHAVAPQQTGACAALPVRFIKKNTLVPFAPFILGGWWVVGQWGAFLEDVLL